MSRGWHYEQKGKGLLATALQRRNAAGMTILGGMLILLVIAPCLYMAAVIVHLFLRRSPDRYVAAVLIIPSATATVVAVIIMSTLTGWPPYFRLWDQFLIHQVVTTEVVLFVIVMPMLMIAPAVAGMWWMLDQRHRERAPVGGEASRGQRVQNEQERRKRGLSKGQEARHVGGRLRKGIALGGELGPQLGIVQDDRGLQWGSVGKPCVMPRKATRHVCVLGGSGSGKSELVHVLAEWTMETAGDQTIYLNGKEAAAGMEPSRRLVAHAADLGKSARALTAEYSKYDPFRGERWQVTERLMSAEVFTEPYYQGCAHLLLALAMEMMTSDGRQASDLADVLRLLCDRMNMMNQAKEHPLAALILSKVDERAWNGVIMRYADAARRLARWTSARDRGGWSWEDAQVCCMDLPTSSEPHTAVLLLRWALADIIAYITDRKRRPQYLDGSWVPLTIILEELSAVDADPVIMRAVANLEERARSADVRMIVVAQAPSGLGEERTASAVLTNSTVITFWQAHEAQVISALGGTVVRLEASTAYEGHGGHDDLGSAREQETYRIHPNDLRSLPVGDAFVFHRGKGARISVAMAKGYYGVRELPKEEIRAMDKAAEEDGPMSIGI